MGGGSSGVRGDIAGGRVAIFDELIEVARGQGAQIGGEVRLAADGAAGVHELVETVLVGVLLVPEACAGGAFLAWADAVAPVVGVGEAAAGPTQYGSLHGAHRVDERLADAIHVRDLRLFADPDAVVDHAAEMLDEVAVDLWRYGGDGLAGENLDVCVRLGRLGEETGAAEGKRRGSQCGGFEEAAARGRSRILRH